MEESIKKIVKKKDLLKQIDVLTEENNSVKKELEDYKNKYMYALADYENYKKNAIKDRASMLKYKDEGIAKDLIEIHEDIIRAVKNEGLENIDKGSRAIFDKFITILNNHNITCMEINKGDQFNVNFMNAISSIPTTDESLNNTICDVLSPCYILVDKVIKYAQVVVYAYSA